MNSMTFSLKSLEKQSPAVSSLLDSIDCDYAFTGSIVESCGSNTHSWFVSRPLRSDEIGIEDALQQLAIPYDRILHGPEFRPFSYRSCRLDENHNWQSLEHQHGDNTLELLDELENAIAGNDYAFARNFIARKRKHYLSNLTWASQQSLAESYEAT